ncbi:MAG: VOC family protein [Deltaproteobacteria bacterium]|nr:VOC family protein [Deltaproteobacteria bacterium]
MAISIERVMHVNVNCSDLERSLAFYRDVVGLAPASHTNPVPQDGAGFGAGAVGRAHPAGCAGICGPGDRSARVEATRPQRPSARRAEPPRLLSCLFVGAGYRRRVSKGPVRGSRMPDSAGGAAGRPGKRVDRTRIPLPRSRRYDDRVRRAGERLTGAADSRQPELLEPRALRRVV